jgi:hypothetical protein
METIHVDCWRHLEQFGINMLTGEACHHSMRLLCDVNADGRDLLLDYFGMPVTTVISNAWNSRVNSEPAVGSFMLHRGSCLQIAEFAMVRTDVKAIVYKGGDAIMGIYTQHMLEQYTKLIEDWPDTTGRWTMRTLGSSNHPHVGSRNTHAMSGRSE